MLNQMSTHDGKDGTPEVTLYNQPPLHPIRKKGFFNVLL